jgi:hypothetical protein
MSASQGRQEVVDLHWVAKLKLKQKEVRDTHPQLLQRVTERLGHRENETEQDQRIRAL